MIGARVRVRVRVFSQPRSSAPYAWLPDVSTGQCRHYGQSAGRLGPKRQSSGYCDSRGLANNPALTVMTSALASCHAPSWLLTVETGRRTGASTRTGRSTHRRTCSSRTAASPHGRRSTQRREPCRSAAPSRRAPTARSPSSPSSAAGAPAAVALPLTVTLTLPATH